MKKKYKDSAQMVKALRARLKCKQNKLADVLEVDRSLVSAFESGNSGPSPQMYIKLRNLAAKSGDYSAALWFWRQADSDLDAMPRVIHVMLGGLADPETPGEVHIVRYTKIGQDPGSPSLRLPAWMIPNPKQTSYARISDEFLAPLLQSGDVIVIDESETEIEKLKGACVAIYDPGTRGGETIIVNGKEVSAESIGQRGILSQLGALRAYGHNGIYTAWVLKDETKEGLVLATPSRHGAIYRQSLEVLPNMFDEGAIVLGRVIGWLPAIEAAAQLAGEKK